MRYIFLLVIFLFSLPVFAAREAVVRKDRAVVYADKSKTGALGFLRMGKKIKVGQREYGPYKMLSVIVSGKVAYIQASDVSFVDTNPLSELSESKNLRSTKARSLAPKMVSISSVRFMRSSMNRTDSDGDGIFGKSFPMYGIQLSSGLMFKNRWLWNIDGSVMMLYGNQTQKRYVALATGAGINLLRLPNFWLNGYMMIGGVPYIRGVGPGNSGQGTGYFFGPKGEAIFELGPSLKISTTLELYHYSFGHFTTEASNDPDAQSLDGYSAKFSAMNVGIGLTWIADFL